MVVVVVVTSLLIIVRADSSPFLPLEHKWGTVTSIIYFFLL